ncbi:MAG: TIGR03960 family B12-binding radical SAM protein [Oscillospiraceae bacterium]|nr:TIGR03960 family B12-binding radical SAM protein [Oscillospiraceae bacterium]
MTDLINRILPRVQKPARYTGGEYNEIIKDKSQVELRVAFCFPDTYEIGMSNLGMRILYGIMNRMEGVWCERMFAPWGDMEEEMRKHNLPLWALESHDPMEDFDLIAFSIGYEMAYSNVLNMLELGHIPLLAKDRGETLRHMVFAGGTSTYNCEPMADFLDFAVIGEGEDLNVEVLECYRSAKRRGLTRKEFLLEVCKIPGVYVPSLYEHTYNEDGTIRDIIPLEGAPETVVKRIVQNMDKAFFPTDTIVPSTQIVHDRTVLEIFRGCIRGCRFCQAGFCYRPVRPKSPERLYELAVKSLENSGYDEITLSSLSTSDYKKLPEFADKMLDYCVPRGINLSLPSLRADNFSVELMEKVQKVRKSGLTFAPEAGTQRLRDAINKNVTEEDILRSCATAFAGGWNKVKLYFMLGLPTETDEDVLGIADLANKVWRVWRENSPNRARGVTITISTAFFVPKNGTPFQWEAQITPEEYLRRCKLLKDNLKGKSIVYNYHQSDLSMLEAVLCRGDRKLCKVLLKAHENGCKMDGWTDYFSMEKWMDAFESCGVDPKWYAQRERGKDERFPWETVSIGIPRKFFWREREAAYRSEITPDCRKQCTGCGANLLYQGGPCDE